MDVALSREVNRQGQRNRAILYCVVLKLSGKFCLFQDCAVECLIGCDMLTYVKTIYVQLL